MKLIYAIFFLINVSNITMAQIGYPVPEASQIRLFYIQHSLNKNTFVYDINIKNNKLDTTEPILIYRITYEDRGIKEQLNAPQRKLAYGIEIDNKNTKRFKFNLVSYKNQYMFLVKSNEKYYVETEVNKKKIYINRMFIQAKQGKLKTKVQFVIFYGTDVATGKSIVEKLNFD